VGTRSGRPPDRFEIASNDSFIVKKDLTTF